MQNKFFLFFESNFKFDLEKLMVYLQKERSTKFVVKRKDVSFEKK